MQRTGDTLKVSDAVLTRAFEERPSMPRDREQGENGESPAAPATGEAGVEGLPSAAQAARTRAYAAPSKANPRTIQSPTLTGL